MLQGCKEVFVRLPQLKSHFEQTHCDLLDRLVSPAELAPLSILSPPHRLRSPPPLPDEQMLSASVLTSISIPRINPGYSQMSASQGLSRKWSRLNMQDNDSDDNPIPFDNLPPSAQNYNTDEPPIVHVEVQRKLPLLKQPLLSRPQPKIHPRIGSEPPEQAILYPSFVRMVDGLVAAGTLAWHDANKN
ncbi:hypothetical protein JVU11DRAFT_6368 [Chiua virens]|nr:hypothetical protein JVU11DRAFT_6368 [Chiua virens]